MFLGSWEVLSASGFLCPLFECEGSCCCFVGQHSMRLLRRALTMGSAAYSALLLCKQCWLPWFLWRCHLPLWFELYRCGYGYKLRIVCPFISLVSFYVCCTAFDAPWAPEASVCPQVSCTSLSLSLSLSVWEIHSSIMLLTLVHFLMRLLYSSVLESFCYFLWFKFFCWRTLYIHILKIIMF